MYVNVGNARERIFRNIQLSEMKLLASTWRTKFSVFVVDLRTKKDIANVEIVLQCFNCELTYYCGLISLCVNLTEIVVRFM